MSSSSALPPSLLRSRWYRLMFFTKRSYAGGGGSVCVYVCACVCVCVCVLCEEERSVLCEEERTEGSFSHLACELVVVGEVVDELPRL
jgi:hypothetical protein